VQVPDENFEIGNVTLGDAKANDSFALSCVPAFIEHNRKKQEKYSPSVREKLANLEQSVSHRRPLREYDVVNGAKEQYRPISSEEIVQLPQEGGLSRAKVITDVPRQTALNTSLTRFAQTTYVKFPGRKCAH